jgi:tRNA pseudouridine65 synthase
MDDAKLNFQIVFEDEALWVVDKPAGMHVHPPQNSPYGIRYEENLMARLRDQVGAYVYPAHRLDPATSGLVILARTGEVAGRLQAQFREHRVRKIYWAVVRGWFGGDGTGRIERELKRDGNGTLAPARTAFRTLGKAELASPVGKYATARYSWIECAPETGVYHQIRRHLSGASHPIVGDTQHGDSDHSRFFRDELGLPGLWLRAVSLRLLHPMESGRELEFQAPADPRWEKLQRKLDFGRSSERMATSFEPNLARG